MTAELTIRVDAESGAPFIRNYTTLEKFDDGPENMWICNTVIH